MPPAHALVPLLLSMLLLIITASPTYTGATDTVSAGRPLAGTSKLVSSNGKFALGFFRLTAGPRNRRSSDGNTAPRWYLGVWFNTVPKLTPAWVANRETPLASGASSELVISSDGNMVIVNTANRSEVLWSSKANTTTNNTVAVLLNTGNVVLADASNVSVVFWQSFDHMTDTVLPEARLSRNKVTGQVTHRVVSNKNLFDLAPGIYSAGASPDFTASYQILLTWNSSLAYWSTGHWNGQLLDNMPESSLSYFFILKLVSTDQEEYLTYHLKNDTMITRYVVDIGGQARNMIWSAASGEWITFSAYPQSQCDVYAVCGPFAVCRLDMMPFCYCMKGFSIKSPEDWELGDFTGGCDRNIPLSCGNNQSGSTDMFFAMTGVRYPESGKHIEVGNADECEQACLSDCSCYAYSDNRRCIVWTSELLNVAQKYTTGGAGVEGVLYIRLAAKELETSKGKRGVLIGSVTSAVIVTSSLIAVGIMLIRRHHSSIKPNNIGGGIVAFRYKDLQQATKGFSEKLGSGGFGTVFKGVLPDSTVIAVKRLDSVRQGDKEFRAEVRSIGMIQHINLVKLIGFCCEGSRRLLVYEFMSNHSLDVHLFQSDDGVSLSWTTRYKIALGVAKGLAYLHEHCQECIIHCDIKPQNILLDASFVPKIADFGMAKFLARDYSRAITTMRGTVGYLAPEWISGVAISSKVDVYSFGVVLLDIIFGRRNFTVEYTSDMTYFPVQVLTQLTEGNVQSLLHQDVQDDINFEEVDRASRVACWCIQDDESSRPTMGQVVQILEGRLDVITPPMPKFFNLFEDVENLSTPKFVCS